METNYFREFGSTLSVARVRLKIKQKDMANRLSVSQSTIASWESGAISPSMRRIQSIATEYRIDQLKLEALFFNAKKQKTAYDKEMADRKKDDRKQIDKIIEEEAESSIAD